MRIKNIDFDGLTLPVMFLSGAIAFCAACWASVKEKELELKYEPETPCEQKIEAKDEQ